MDDLKRMRKCDPLDIKGFWIADLCLTDVNTIKSLFGWEGVKLLQEHLDWAVCHIENIPLAQACLELGAKTYPLHFKSAQTNVQMMILLLNHRSPKCSVVVTSHKIMDVVLLRLNPLCKILVCGRSAHELKKRVENEPMTRACVALFSKLPLELIRQLFLMFKI